MVLREVLMSNLVYILLAELCLFIAFLIFNLRENRETVNKFFKSIRKERVILIFMIFFTLFVFTMLISYMCIRYPQGKMFTLAVAKGFTEGKTNLFYNDGSSVRHQNDLRDPYSHGPFYPFVVSIVFSLFGTNTYHIYIIDALSSTLVTLFVFLIIFVLTRDKKISIYGMIISGTLLIYYILAISDYILVQFFLLIYSMSLFLMFFSFKKNTFLSYSLFSISLLFLIQTRAEGVVVLFAFIIGLVLYRKNNMKDINFWLKKILPSLLIFLIFIPVTILHYSSHYFYESPEPGYFSLIEATNSLFRIFSNQGWANPISMEFFISNFSYFWTKPLFLPTLLFAFLGIAFGLMKKRNAIVILLILFLSHNMIYLLWNNGYQMRYAFQTIIPYILFASLGFIPVENFLLRYKDRFKRLVLPPTKYKFRPLLFVIPVFLLAVLAFFTADIITNQAICTSNPLDISGFQSNLQPFIEEMKDPDANILILGNEIIMSKAEFVLVKNVYSVNDHIQLWLFVSDPIANSTYSSIIQTGAFSTDQEMMEERQRILDLCFKLSVDDILMNEEKKTKFKSDLIRENTYLLTECEYMNLKDVEYTFELMNELFVLELIYEKDCLYVYKVKG